MRLVKVNETSAAKRRVFFQITGTDGVTPALGEATGQPQICTNGIGGFVDAGIGTLTHIGSGRYYAELTTGAVDTIGDELETRYKSGSTAESVGDSVIVVAYDPYGTGAAAGGVANPGATGGMTLSQARDWVRFYARDAAGDDSAYEDNVIDFAIQAVLEQFCRVTKCVRGVSDVDVLEGVATVDTSGLSGFHPERIVNARIDGQANPLNRPDYTELVRLQQTQGGTGCPTSLAFDDGVTDEGGLHYTPDADYTLKLSWYQPFTTWTPGVDSATADAIVLNCPPDLLLRVLPFGPPSMLQHTDPKMRYASESWKKYLLVEEELRGAKLQGARTVRRNMAQW